MSPTAWSWKRALVRAALAFVGTIVVGAAAYAVLRRPESNDAKFGEGLGQLSVFAAAVAFAASWLAQTGRRRTAIGVVAGFVLIVGGAFAAILLIKPAGSAARPLTAAERAPLVVVDEGGQRRLRHPAFGFSFLHPGPGFHDAPEVAATAGGDRTMQTYGFVDREGQAALIVSLMNGMGASRAALSDHLDGFQRGVAGSVADKSDLHWLKREITWDDSGHVGRVSGSTGGLRMEIAAYAVARPGQAPFIVNLTITARDTERFADLLASFRP